MSIGKVDFWELPQKENGQLCNFVSVLVEDVDLVLTSSMKWSAQ